MVPFSAYQELVKELANLKREGFVPSQAVEAPQQLPDLPGPVRKAIHDLAVEAPVERHLVKQAWEMLKAGEAEEIVAQKITDGEEVAL